MAMTRTTPDQVLAVARHPSFTADMSVTLVRGLPWRRLVAIWDASSHALRSPQTPAHVRMAHVALRDALLDEMEIRHARDFETWDPWSIS